jgi:hypothetical protein
MTSLRLAGTVYKILFFYSRLLVLIFFCQETKNRDP